MDHRVAIRAQGLWKTYGPRTVLARVNLEIRSGELVILKGENGSGKSTLLSCLAGLTRPDAGHVSWFGRSPAEPGARCLIGMAAHETYLYPHLTLRENLVFAARILDVAKPAREACNWLERSGLSGHADRLPREVSQGMRRRASIARALIHNPPLALLDEPFAGLDQAGKLWLCDVITARRSQGQATCLVAHEDALPPEAADQVLELRWGRLQPWAASSASVLARLLAHPLQDVTSTGMALDRAPLYEPDSPARSS